MNEFFNTDDIKEEYDVIIIGAGPAGCAAGVYSARDELSTLILEKSYPGGNVAITDMVENYPGFESEISGADLSKKFFLQAKRFGALIRYGICKQIGTHGKYKTVTLDGGKVIKAKSVIIATGSHPKRMGAIGEGQFIGRGVSFCATCDGGFYKEKEVAVIGGGNSALEEGMYLTRFASKVTIIHRREEFRATKIVQKRALENDKIHFMTPYVVEEVLGETKVTGLRLKNAQTGEEKTLNVDGVFVFVGWDANTEAFENVIKLTPDAFIDAGEDTKTNIDGVFAAGDVRKKELMQIVTAVSDGAMAAKMAEKHITDHFTK